MRNLISAALLTAVAMVATSAVPLWAVQTDTHGLHAVPVPGPVAIDGKLADWDLSGSALMCYDVETLRDVYSAEVAVMHDAANLYVSLRWKDPLPMGNSHDPRYEAHKGWAGDGIQLRVRADRICHVTAWYYAARQEPFINIEYGKGTEPFGGGAKNLTRTDGWKLTDGAEMAFLKDADGKGYVQEMKLPWAVLTSDGKAPAEGRLACGVELLWGESDWPVHRYADNLTEGTTSREFFWTAVRSWGPVILEPKGKLTLPPPSWSKALEPETSAGPVPVAYELPNDARVTIAINDAQGRRVRNLLPAAARKAGKNSDHWDGLDDDGKPVPPGDYRISGLHHQGIRVNWAMSFASPGDPPWDTADGNGAFYGDHSSPQAATAAGNFVALACPMGEAGKHLIGCDLNGKRIWGLANRTAFDGGRIALATDGKTLWVANEGKKSLIYRVELATGRYAPWDAKAKDDEGREYQVLDLPVSELPGMAAQGHGGHGQGKPNLSAIAVQGEVLAVCLTRENAVKLFNAKTGVVTKTIAIDEPRSVVFDKDNTLVVLAKTGLVRITADGAATPFTSEALADAWGIAIDAERRVYVSVRGAEQQVRVYGADGKRLRSIGKAGGRPNHGAFIDGAMRLPAGIAIDSKGRLWVTEETMNPKRTSVWSPEGELLFDLVGTTGYCNSGAINPADPTMGFAEDVIFKLDLAKGTSRPVWSLGETGNPDQLFPPRTQLRAKVVLRDDLTWLYWTGTARGANEVHCTVRAKDGAWNAGFHMGVVNRREKEGEWVKYAHRFFDGHDGELYTWSDRNADGTVQAEELTFAKPTHEGKPVKLRSFYWGQLPDDKGTIAYLDVEHGTLVQFPVSGVTACGAPIYDIANPRVVKTDRSLLGKGNGEGMVQGGTDGVFYINQDPIIAISADGNVLGQYPNRFTSVHGSHNAKAAKTGYIIGPSSVLGTAAMGGEAGEVFDLNGNLGENYLFTRDCLFIQSLFKDVRGGFETPTKAVRGMPMDATSAGGESFGGNFTRTSDGKVWLTIGNTDARVLEVKGLDTIRRFSGALTYTPEQFAAAQKLMQERAVRHLEAKAAKIPRATAAPTVDGKLDEWPELADGKPGALELQENAHQRYARVALRWDDQRLHVAWRVLGRGSLRNAGQDERLLFKSGDVVDLMIAGATNQRLLLTAPSGKPIAIHYLDKVTGTAEKDRVPFSSPWRTIHFDRVTRVDDVTVATAPTNGGYAVEASVPWSRLGITPKAGLALKGDVGVLMSDQGGTTTVARHYWSNQATNLVNDVPGEAELQPALWGTFTLE